MRPPRNRVDRVLGALSRIDGDPGDPGPVDWNLLFRRSVRERTAGLVAAAIERLGLRVPGPAAEAFAAVRTRLLAVQVLRSRDRDEALRSLRGIPAVVFKGLDLLERAYRTPGVRDMADIDLLVPPEAFDEACAALSERGWSAPLAPSRALALASGRRVNSLLLSRPDRTPMHLHWHFANASLPLPYARVPAKEVFGHVRGGSLDPEATYVLLCEHAMKHSFSALVHLSDVSAVWTRLRPDPGATLALARRWGLDLPVRCASILSRRLLGTPVDGAVADPRGLGAEARILLRSALSGRRFDGLSALGFLSMQRGLRAKFAFLRSTLLPGEGDMELFGKGAGRGAMVRRAFRAVGMMTRGMLGTT